MRRIVKFVIEFFNRIINSVKWVIGARHLKASISTKALKSFDFRCKSLILAPHSDDEWIGCNQIMVNGNTILCNMDMLGNDSSENHAIRKKEMADNALTHNVPFVDISGNKTEFLKQLIRKEKPSFILVPFYIDWHKEHIETMLILKNALEDYCCDICLYQVSCPLPLNAVNFAIPMSKKEWKDKWRLFRKKYKTQKRFPWRRFALIEKAEGKYSGSFASSPYCVLKSDEWQERLIAIPSEEERLFLYSNLNNLKINFNYINNLHKRIDRQLNQSKE